VVGAVLLTSMGLHAETAKQCTERDDREIAQVVKHLPATESRKAQVLLKTASNETVTIPAWQLQAATPEKQYVKIQIRRDRLGV
tara:strand:+ start:4117 stop:4368 length:252 start_codon:yes stop_codon:yes gene_type:complete